MSKYYVWKRNDDWVDSSCHAPNGWKASNGEIVTFEILKVFDEWDRNTVDFIQNQRDLVKNTKH